MTVTASCGHVLRDNEGADGFGHPISVKSWSRENTPAVNHMCVCDKCLEKYDELTYFEES